MVGRCGMSDAIGPVAVIPADGREPFFPPRNSEETQGVVDEEVRRLVARARADVAQLLREHRVRLDSSIRAGRRPRAVRAATTLQLALSS